MRKYVLVKLRASRPRLDSLMIRYFPLSRNLLVPLAIQVLTTVRYLDSMQRSLDPQYQIIMRLIFKNAIA